MEQEAAGKWLGLLPSLFYTAVLKCRRICVKIKRMNFELLAERTRYLKENPRGVSEMCKVIEDMRTQVRKETMAESALRMLHAGKYALEEIVAISGLSLDEVKKLDAGQNA